MKTLKGLVKNRKMIASLAMNDFRTKYAGTQFGIIWAFVQPVITIIIYIFVFQVIAKANPLEGGFPFVLWLIAGMVPWFFFSEAVMNGTGCLIDYSYLVKKVVFHIDVLPVVRVLSAIFVHLFFVVFTMIVFAVSGKQPTVYYLQILYYMFCGVALAASVSYITSSVVPFFKDFTQTVNILLMVGMWACPVMWDYKTVMPDRFHWILRLNPMFYIVQGYRDAFVEEIWFWQRPAGFFWFWITVLLIWMVGTRMFERLRVHFPDVL
ncbi:MAG: ABC transporter permease [Eubacterium sp.]|nr:ABC transporter permease [Eubacterium sp.]